MRISAKTLSDVSNNGPKKSYWEEKHINNNKYAWFLYSVWEEKNFIDNN